MVENFYKKNKDLIVKTVLIILLIIFVYLFLNVIFSYVAPFVFGYLISLIIHPLVNMLHKKYKINKGFSAFLLILLFVIIVGTLGTILVIKLGNEAKSFFEYMPYYLTQLQATFSDLLKEYERFMAFIPDQLEGLVKTAFSNIITGLTSNISGTVRQSSFSVVGSIPNFLLSVILCLISAFFFTKDKHKINAFLSDVSPLWLSEGFGTIKTSLINSVMGYIKAQLILMSITATICVLGLSIIRFPYALLVGLTASLIDALPVFGVGFVLWPLAFINLLSGNYGTAIKLMIIYLIVIVMRQLNEPKILGDQIGLHPLLTLMSMYIGLKVFGLLGFIIGPMILIVSKVIYTSETIESNGVNSNSV